MPTIGGIFSSPVRKYRKRYCTTPVISVSICGCVRFNTNVKVLCQSDLIFLNPQMDLVYIWYDYRCWSKILLSTSVQTRPRQWFWWIFSCFGAEKTSSCTIGRKEFVVILAANELWLVAFSSDSGQFTDSIIYVIKVYVSKFWRYLISKCLHGFTLYFALL